MSTTYPANLNPLSPNGFQFSIEQLPDLTYFSQGVTLPGIQLPNIVQSTPFADIKYSGTNPEYETLDIDFLVDEGMVNYIAIYNWIVALGFPETYDQYIGYAPKSSFLSNVDKNFSDATLTILGSNNLPVRSITFIDMIPVGLSSMRFTTTTDDVQYITCTASFEYSYYRFN